MLGCRPAARLRRRVECGVRLYREGVAPVLLLSGGGNGPEPEAEIMRHIALAHGVPPAALLIEPHSRDTVGNARETARLLRAHGLRSAVLVSDRAHLPTGNTAVSPRRGRCRRPIGAALAVAAGGDRCDDPRNGGVAGSLFRALLTEREGRRR